ncbi:hypothetical protein [Actinoalloteichus spitiensis]|uniref:hypothetical protein n=1 Tax=Actinoalloteichus spitiensis TaxID=252394 RepID=UPI0012F6FBA8|nr:hypothetical protein [Actinoalloteichus spitiensis]
MIFVRGQLYSSGGAGGVNQGGDVAFLDQRRELRPVAEYRDATSGDGAAFDEHFDERKVELGSCGIPAAHPASTDTPASAAPCRTSTRRCPPGSTNSKPTCSTAAPAPKPKGWAGEIDGIDMPLTFLRAKRDDTQRRLRPTCRRPRDSGPRASC